MPVLPSYRNQSIDLLANDTSLFSVVQKIYQWAHQQKIKYNPVAIKQAQAIVFSRKVSKHFHPDVYFNNNPVSSTSVHKHLGMILDFRLCFEEHLKSVLEKVNKTIRLIRKFRLNL